MAGFRVEGNTSGNVAEVDSGNNLKVSLPVTSDVTQIGKARIMFERDDGSLSGTANLASAMVSLDKRPMVGMDTPQFEFFFTATSQDTGKWYHAFSTMTMTQAGGTLLTNAASTATATTGCLLYTKQYMDLLSSGSLRVKFNQLLTANPLANQVYICGLGYNTTATAAPVDGVWFKISNAGIEGIVSYNGTPTSSGILYTPTQINNDVGVMKEYSIIIHQTSVEFWYGGKRLGAINTPSDNPQPIMSVCAPIIIQQYNTGTVSGSPQMQVKVGSCSADYIDMNVNKPFAHVMCGLGRGCYQGQEGGTMGSTANYANSTNFTSAAGSNTAANSTGLGGQGAINAAAGAATDYIATSYQVPVGGVNQAPSALYVTGIRISAMNDGAAVTTTPTTLQWGIAFGHTAVSLATTESGSFATGTTKVPRRIALGYQSVPVGAAIGAVYSSDIYMPFNSPIVVNPGEYFATFFKQITGTATASQIIRYTVTIDGYFA